MKSTNYDDRLNLRLTSQERELLAEVARRQERTLSQQIRYMVRLFLAGTATANEDTAPASEATK